MAARDCKAATPDNIYTALMTGNKFCGHYWKYEGDLLTLEQAEARAQRKVIDGANKSKATMIAARRKAVLRVSDGKTYQSVASAARSVGCNHSAIQRALKLGTNSMGSGWSYV
jgi:hypothetical protein